MEMRILVCGARGFIGRQVVKTLEAAGHTCIRGVRKARPGANYISIDFTRDLDPANWLPRLKNIDAVINVIGILRETRLQPMGDIHGKAPAALFAACAQAGVKHVVQLSALGVGGELGTRYFKTKEFAEQALKKQGDRLRYLILRPSVIYGENGASSKMFRLQAKMLIQPLPMGGGQLMQPVHVDDLVQVIENWLEDEQIPSQTIVATGSKVVSMAQMLASFRRQLGFGKAWQIPVPGFLVKLAAWCGDSIPASPLSTDTLRMLNAGSVGDNAAFVALLGREPVSVDNFIRPLS